MFALKTLRLIATRRSYRTQTGRSAPISSPSVPKSSPTAPSNQLPVGVAGDELIQGIGWGGVWGRRGTGAGSRGRIAPCPPAWAFDQLLVEVRAAGEGTGMRSPEPGRPVAG